MPDAVERYGEMAAFASLRKPAWHDLGTVFDKPVSTKEMLELAHMANWNLRLRLLETDAYSDKDEFEVLRDNPFMGRVERLGLVGKRYNPFDNESIFDFGDNLTNERRRWETAGSLDGGRKVFATLVATDDLVLDPNGAADVIKKYLLLSSSHDGTGVMTAKKVDLRVVCKNTLNIALGEGGAEFKIRHTQGMATKLEDARKALGFAELYDDVFEKEVQALFEAEMTMTQFERIVLDIFPEPDEEKKGALTRWENKIDTILDVWQDGTGSVTNLPNSAYKGLQVLTEHNQWFRGIRDNDEENFFAAGAGFDLKTNRFRTEAFERMKEFAEV